MSSQDSIYSYDSDENNHYWFSDETRSGYSSDSDNDSNNEDDYVAPRFQPFQPKPTVSSPLNLTMTVIEIPPKGDDGWGSALREKKETISLSPSLPSPPSSSSIEIPTDKKTAWKPIDTTIQPPRDPWAFLEKPQSVPNPSRSSKSVSLLGSSPNPSRSSKPVSLLNRNTNPRTEFAEYNKLCKYKDSCRMHRDGNCTMVHSLRDWKPKICRFNTTCSKKTICGYHHSDVPLREYLSIMIKKKDTLYSKNANLYQQYL